MVTHKSLAVTMLAATAMGVKPSLGDDKLEVELVLELNETDADQED